MQEAERKGREEERGGSSSGRGKQESNKPMGTKGAPEANPGNGIRVPCPCLNSA